MTIKSHWEKIYKEKSPQEVSWTQEIPSTSITFFNEFNLNKTSPIIDVGGGESKIVDYLIDKGYQDVSVLDISEIIEHPYVIDRQILINHFNSEFGNIMMHQAFPRLSKTPGKVTNSAPSIGENTNEILKEIGYTDKEISRLYKDQIIGCLNTRQ